MVEWLAILGHLGAVLEEVHHKLKDSVAISVVLGTGQRWPLAKAPNFPNPVFADSPRFGTHSRLASWPKRPEKPMSRDPLV